LLCVLASLSGVFGQAVPRVLQVGTFKGKPGQYSTIQEAVNAAHPGDWILVAPGTYHDKGSDLAGVLITTPGIHLRGLDRNGVVVDETNGGVGTCSSDPAAQDFAPGGDGSGQIGMSPNSGAYLTASSTFFQMGTPNVVSPTKAPP
jgi:pectin methylesterase-like acyl-CoA thioesterase